IRQWLSENENSDAVIISDDPQRTELADLKIEKVMPDILSLFEIASPDMAVEPVNLKIVYYRKVI
ncbi:MAG: hypothetical protein IJR11_00990, partial [Synergistaceae bacterium]|nr:hypothetical protein [Synergistaceae bacterium]